MSLPITFLRLVALVAFILVSNVASAVCLDPKDPTLKRYYYPSIEEEAKASPAIVVGTVIAVDPKSEDPSDPDGWTSLIYTFKVTQQLRGSVPATIQLRAGNDSGGYRMTKGETHVLFLRKEGTFFVADPCGNSANLAEKPTILEQIKAFLAGATHVV